MRVETISPDHQGRNGIKLETKTEVIKSQEEDRDAPNQPMTTPEESEADDQEEMARVRQKMKLIVDRMQGGGDNDAEAKTFQKMIDTKNKVDPYANIKEGVFRVRPICSCSCGRKVKLQKNPKTVVYDIKSLYMFHAETNFRQFIVQLTESKWFDRIVIFIIILNSIALASLDYQDRNNLTFRNQLLEKAGIAFSCLFMVECILKVISMGFIKHYNSYLRDPWNWIDFAVVIIGVIEMTPIPTSSLKALRTLRVLRPLRTVNAFPSMRRLISSLLASLPSLGNAVVFMMFVFLLFGILGVQQFGGTFYRRCRITPEKIEGPDGNYTWPFDDTEQLCALDSQGMGFEICEEDYTCGDPWMQQLGREIDHVEDQVKINYGITNFDNLASGILTIFQMITLEGWTDIMYNLMDSNMAWMAVLFCCLLVIIGSFFLLNVILAVLAEALDRVDAISTKATEKEAEKIARAVHRARKRQKEAKEKGATSNEFWITDSETEEQLNKQEKEIEEPAVLSESSSSSSSPSDSKEVSAVGGNNLMVDSQTNIIDRSNNPLQDEPSMMSDRGGERSSQPELSLSGRAHSSIRRHAGVIVPDSLNTLQLPKKNDVRLPPIIGRRGGLLAAADLSDIQKQQVSELDEALQLKKVDQSSTQKEGTDKPKSLTSNAPLSIVSASELRMNRVVTKRLADEKAKETPQEELLVPDRAKNNCFYRFFFVICSNGLFTILILVGIIANTILLALDKFEANPESEKTIETINQFFTWFFLLEMIIRLIGLGFKEYLEDSFNRFDAIIVVISLVETIIGWTTSSSASGAFSAFRAIRIARVFKLAKSWKSFKKLLNWLVLTIKDISTFSVLMGIFMFIFTLLGMELFGHKVKFDEDDRPVEVDPDNDLVNMGGVYPRNNFNEFIFAVTTIFIVFIGDDWNNIMYEHFRAMGGVSIAFFVIIFILGNLVLLNLFLAMLLTNFSQEDEIPSASEGAEMSYFFRLRRNCRRRYRKCCIKGDQKHDNMKITPEPVEEPIEDRLKRLRMLTPGVKGQNNSHFIERDVSALQASILEHNLSAPDVENYDLNPRRGSQTMEQYVSSSKQRSLQIPGAVEDVDESQESSSESLSSDVFSSEDNEAEKGDDQGESEEGEPASSKQTEGIKSLSSLKRGNAVTNNKIKEARKRPPPIRRRSTAMAKFIEKHEAKQRRIKEEQIVKSHTKVTDALLKLKLKKLATLYIKKVLPPLEGKSLYLFGPGNNFRLFLQRVMLHSWFDPLVLFLIGASSIMLTLDSPIQDPTGKRAMILQYIDVVFTVLFTLECVIKITVLGFACNGPQCYMRNGWCIMDFFIVLFSIISILPLGVDLGFIKVLRMIRVLRPLRLISRNPGLKLAVQSLINAIPGVGNLLVICFLVLLLFSILGVQFFKGSFYSCNMENVPKEKHLDIHTMWECLDYGGEWENAPANFDNVPQGMMTLFNIITTEGWVQVMWMAVDSTKPYQVPKENNNILMVLFFIMFLILGSLIILNLFVGVVIYTFQIEKEKLSLNGMLTSIQMEYCDVLINVYKSIPVEVYESKGNKIVDFCHFLTKTKAFDMTINIVIIINILGMTITWYGEPDIVGKIGLVSNYVFSIIYTLEAIVKIIAQRKAYFRDGWNIFDFIIVIAAWLGVVLQEAIGIEIGASTTIIRSFRISRMLKLIKKYKGLSMIFNTFIVAIPELANVGALLVLFLFLYAVLGNYMFAAVQLGDALNSHANFQTFFNSMLTLFRMSTGEAWNEIMFDAARERSITNMCVAEQTYEEMQRDGILGCGNLSMASIYFISFMLLVSFMFLNLFIAIILEGFTKSQQEQDIRVKHETFQIFIDAWQKYDETAAGIIKETDLQELILDILQKELKIKQEFLQQLIQSENVLFNLNQHRDLVIFLAWKRDLDNDQFTKQMGENIQKVKNDVRLQRQATMAMRRFIIDLAIPSYNHMQNYAFHDVLCSFVRQMFKLQHKNMVQERKERIKICRETGQDDHLTALVDNLEFDTPEFWALTPQEQENFFELDREDFQEIINRMEQKGLDNDKILKLEEMRRKRAATDKFISKKNQLDINTELNWAFDSSHVQGAKVIKKHINRLNERSNTSSWSKIGSLKEIRKSMVIAKNNKELQGVKFVAPLEVKEIRTTESMGGGDSVFIPSPFRKDTLGQLTTELKQHSNEQDFGIPVDAMKIQEQSDVNSQGSLREQMPEDYKHSAEQIQTFLNSDELKNHFARDRRLPDSGPITEEDREQRIKGGPLLKKQIAPEQRFMKSGLVQNSEIQQQKSGTLNNTLSRSIDIEAEFVHTGKFGPQNDSEHPSSQGKVQSKPFSVEGSIQDFEGEEPGILTNSGHHKQTTFLHTRDLDENGGTAQFENDSRIGRNLQLEIGHRSLNSTLDQGKKEHPEGTMVEPETVVKSPLFEHRAHKSVPQVQVASKLDSMTAKRKKQGILRASGDKIVKSNASSPISSTFNPYVNKRQVRSKTGRRSHHEKDKSDESRHTRKSGQSPEISSISSGIIKPKHKRTKAQSSSPRNSQKK